MKEAIYPAIFHKAEAGGYWVEFPDLPGCVTEGDSLEEAFNMAADALFVWIKEDEGDRPKPTDISTVKTENGDFATLIKAEPYESDSAVKFKAAEAIENGLAERKLNKNQAAQILGVDRSYFTYIVNGKKTPSPEMAKRIALLLGIDWHVFYTVDYKAADCEAEF